MSQPDTHHRVSISFRSSSSRPRAASALTTSIRACSRSASCSCVGPIDDYVANVVVAQLLFLESENPDKDINLYINSPGGSVTAGLAIYDTMQFLKPDVSTMCIGQAASMGSLLLAAGAKGKRYALPHSRIMIHQPSRRHPGPGRGHRHPRARDHRDTQRLNEILATHTGQPIEQIERDTDRDRFMSSEDARNYGLIDAVLEKRPVDDAVKPPDPPDQPLVSADFPSVRAGPASGPLCYSPLHPCAKTSEAEHDRRPAKPIGRQRQDSLLLVLRQEPARGPQADRGPVACSSATSASSSATTSSARSSRKRPPARAVICPSRRKSSTCSIST